MPSPERDHTGRRLAVLAIFILGSLLLHLGVDAAINDSPWSNRDVAFLLSIAEEVADGARLYVDWHENNLPSIFMMSLPAVQGARFLEISSIPVYNAMVLALAALGMWVLVSGLRGLQATPLASWLAGIAYLLLVLHPGQYPVDFGERDHLFALMLCAEVFALAGGYAPRWRTLWCFGLAFVAMFRPHFALLLALVEFTAPPAMRPRRAVLAAFALGGLSPFAMLALHSPDSVRGLFENMLPVHLDGSYAVINKGLAALLHRGPLLIAAVAMAASVALGRAPSKQPASRWLVRSGWLALAFTFLSVVQQGKYFSYHFIPLWGLATVLLGWAIGESVRDSRAWRSAILGIAVACLAGGTLKTHISIGANCDQLPVRIGKALPDGRRLLTVTNWGIGLCSPYPLAPRCVGPRAFDLRLAFAGTSERQAAVEAALADLRAALALRPELVAFGVAETLADGRRPIEFLLDTVPLLPPGEYEPLSAPVDDYVGHRGAWRIFRRADIAEVVPAAPR